MTRKRSLRPIWCASMGLWIRCSRAAECPHARRLVEVSEMVEKRDGCSFRAAQVRA